MTHSTTKYIQRITRITVLPAGEPLLCEKATHISIEDEAAGEFLVVEQFSGCNGKLGGDDEKPQKIRIDQAEWPALKAGIEKMLMECGDPAADEISGDFSDLRFSEEAATTEAIEDAFLKSKKSQ